MLLACYFFYIKYKCDQLSKHFILEYSKGILTNAFSLVFMGFLVFYTVHDSISSSHAKLLSTCLCSQVLMYYRVKWSFSAVCLSWLFAYRPDQTTLHSKTVSVKPVLNLGYGQFSRLELCAAHRAKWVGMARPRKGAAGSLQDNWQIQKDTSLNGQVKRRGRYWAHLDL